MNSKNLDRVARLSCMTGILLGGLLALALFGGCTTSTPSPKERELAREMRVCVGAFEEGGHSKETSRTICSCFLPTLQDKVGDLRMAEHSPVTQVFTLTLLHFCVERHQAPQTTGADHKI